MITAEILDRLRARCGDVFATIATTHDLANVADNPGTSPAAYVVPLREASAANDRMTDVLQRCESDIGVIIVLDESASSSSSSTSASPDLDALKAAVRDALIGWQPASAEVAITHVSGELTQGRDGTVWWEEVFATAYLLGPAT
ncbi:hypothetical protein LQ948_04780 [Jiella sp. MQZ9-1]|uniref:Uncharacterized protein n=1 Tax=Jiella flava TaxID=2816857 RepID=A0A939JWC1_9HYPH|nr:hypothetical protein [Jiella flava]MBO0662151.1 hypothetical protein [Jiella flava]MCD2470520.1 hypothetical protein [Jiella flava]